jgi:hypothetical protein
VSRIIIDRHNTDKREERFVIGWDSMLATYFWQVMGDGDLEGTAVGFMGYKPSELATWGQFVDSLPEEYKNSFSERVIRPLLERLADDSDANGRKIIDTTEWPSWICEVVADKSGHWSGNGIIVGSKEEAEAYAKNLAARWYLVERWRVCRSPESPNYKIDVQTGEMLERVQ